MAGARRTILIEMTRLSKGSLPRDGQGYELQGTIPTSSVADGDHVRGGCFNRLTDGGY
jgi:hypothetical protein